jgi:hypothetical protein
MNKTFEGRKLMKTLITICCIAVMMLVVVPAQAVIITLDDLLQPGATITSGDKLFSNFDNWETTSVNPTDILVTPYQNPTNLEYGLKFTSDALKLTSGGGLSAGFDFIVTPTLAGYLISDNTLTMTGSGNGTIYLSETASDAATGAQLAYKDNYIMGNGTVQKLTDHQIYTVPTRSVLVHKYIQLDWAGSTPPAPQVTEFTQTFSQVPEPATLAILGLGSLLFVRSKK